MHIALVCFDNFFACDALIFGAVNVVQHIVQKEQQYYTEHVDASR